VTLAFEAAHRQTGEIAWRHDDKKLLGLSGEYPGSDESAGC
jgi:hypothetical protein